MFAAAGPIKTEIWEGAVQNAECVGQHSSAFDPFVQHSHKVVGALTKQPGWFLPASAVGQKVCKVGGFELFGQMPIERSAVFHLASSLE